jgi:outer membrane lipoprotein-sorting protein
MKRNLMEMVHITATGLLMTAFWCMPAQAQKDKDAPSVGQIVTQANQIAYYQGKDGKANVHMSIVDAQGRERTRRFTILRRDDLSLEEKEKEESGHDYTGDQRFYVYFNAPPDVSKTVFMVWKHVALDRDDDRWLYLPDLDLVKRIAASDERTSFVGSHFFYEDVSGRNTNEDQHTLADVTDTYYVLDHTPKKPDEVEFSHYKMWIHRDTYLPVQTEYYDKRGELYRRYTALKVSEPQGFITVTQAKMENLRSGGYTTITYSNVTYNIGLPKDIFSERYLRKPPMKYLKK